MKNLILSTPTIVPSSYLLLSQPQKAKTKFLFEPLPRPIKYSDTLIVILQTQFKIQTIMKFKLALLALLLTCTLTFNSSLPELLKRTYHTAAENTINATVGQRFSLPLPQFDSPWTHRHFQTYQLTQEQFKANTALKKVFNHSSAQVLPMDYLPLNCTLVEPAVSIAKELKSLPQNYNHIKSGNWQQNSYLLLSSKQLLYVLNSAGAYLSAYIFNDHSLEKITSYHLPKGLYGPQQLNGQANTSPPLLTSDSREQFVYIFASGGIWQIDTKTILTNVRKINTISGFNSYTWKGLDRVLHGQSQLLVGLKKMEKVFIIPEPSSHHTSTFTEIDEFKGTTILPQDIAIMSNIIFILDFYKGIYIFQLLNKKAVPMFSIPLTTFGGNYQFKIFSPTINAVTIFVNFNDIDGSKVAQLSVDMETSQYSLVRFFKSGEFINIMKTFSVPTQYHLQPSAQRYQEQYFDTFLFLLQNQEDIEIYPFNLDPRIINQAYNAVKLKGNGIKEFFHIVNDRFIIITTSSIKYVRIAINKPSVSCLVQQSLNGLAQNYYLLKLTSNTSSCQHYDHSQPPKKLNNEYCQLSIDYYLHMGDPEASQHQKALLYGLVIVVVFGFIGGLLYLMQWRNNKMVILGRLRSEIVNFRNRHKRIQPFVQQNYQHKEIQIDVPKISAVLEEDKE